MTVHLKQDEPDTSNRLDGMKQGVIGQPISRVEGLAKVTGTAPYAAEYAIEGCVEPIGSNQELASFRRHIGALRRSADR